MTWNTPRTDWQPNEIVTADDMNAIGQNLNTLRNPAFSISDVDHNTDFTTTSATFTNVDPEANVNDNQLALQVTTTGGPLLVTFAGAMTHSSLGAGNIYLNLALDNTNVAADDGILSVAASSGNAVNASFGYWLTGVSAGTHTVHLRWRTSGGTARLWAGAGTSGADIHPQFAVREVS